MILYPNSVIKIMEDTNYDFIPKKIYIEKPLEEGHKYWSDQVESTFKVYSVFTVGDIVYYTIKLLQVGRFAVISSPISSNTYELIYNKKHIERLDTIIDTGESYKGISIKAWVCKNYNKDRFTSKLVKLNDNAYYFVSSSEDSKKFRITRDTTKSPVRR